MPCDIKIGKIGALQSYSTQLAQKGGIYNAAHRLPRLTTCGRTINTFEISGSQFMISRIQFLISLNIAVLSKTCHNEKCRIPDRKHYVHFVVGPYYEMYL